jgi:hypothetical protein
VAGVGPAWAIFGNIDRKRSDIMTVQDETLKNIMISWYYAGYYTGLHAGQQQSQKDVPPKQ